VGLTESFVPVRELPPRPLMVAGCTAAKVAREAMALVPKQLSSFFVFCVSVGWNFSKGCWGFHLLHGSSLATWRSGFS
jgi:squalene cyclase